jgi:hypothetical protein
VRGAGFGWENIVHVRFATLNVFNALLISGDLTSQNGPDRWYYCLNHIINTKIIIKTLHGIPQLLKYVAIITNTS